MKTIKNLKVTSTLIAYAIFFAIPSFFLFGLIGNLMISSVETLLGSDAIRGNVLLMLSIAVLSIAIWIPVTLKYAYFYFKIINKYNFKGWLNTKAY